MTFTLHSNASVVVIPVVVDEYHEPEGRPDRTAFKALPRIADDLLLLKSLFESTAYVQAGFQCADPIRGVDASEIERGLKALRTALEAASRTLSVLVFWSGHAKTVENELRLVTGDCYEPMKASDGYAPRRLVEVTADFGPRALMVVLDVCQAAAAALDTFEVVAKRSLDRTADDDLVMVALFAAYPFQPAHDGAFAECFVRLLREGPSAAARRRMGETDRYPINVKNRRLTLSEVAEAVILEMELLPPGRHRSTPRSISSGLPPPLFPNPDYEPNAPPINVEVARQLARRADLDTHFMPKARGLEPGETGWFFSGRREISADIVRWLDRPDAAKGGVYVLTGSGGTGKSALLGRLVALSDDASRAVAQEQGWRADDDSRDGTVPAIGSIDAALNLRGLGMQQAMQALAELLGMTKAGTSVDPSTFVAQVPATRADDARATTIVLDALDESSEPLRLGGSLLPALAQRGVRLLVGTRPGSPHGTSGDLLELLRRDGVVEHVDDLDALHDVRADIRGYVDARLAASPLAASAAALADVVAGRADGKFLFARMATAALLRGGATDDLAVLNGRIARGVGDALQRELREMDGAFQQRFGRTDDGASALFAALAFAEGAGLPVRDGLWPLVATALGGLVEPLDEAHARWVLIEGGRYVIEVGDGEQAAYRLYHQVLVEELRARSTDVGDAQAIVAATLESHAAAVGGWADANPYAIRHVVAHRVASARDPTRPLRLRLERIVCDFAWLRARLELDGVYVLLTDLEAALQFDLWFEAARKGVAVAALMRLGNRGHEGIRRVERALRQSAAVLAGDPSQLSTHLIGRLRPDLDPGDPLTRLLRDARALAIGPWLRPLTASLWSEASRRWLRPGDGTLTAIAFSPDGRYAVHYGYQTNVNLWDLAAWQHLGTLFEPPRSVGAMAITNDARHVLFDDFDDGMSRWSRDGGLIALGKVHPEQTQATHLHLSDDGRFALSGTSDGSSVVAWDFESRRHEVLFAVDRDAGASRSTFTAIAMSRAGDEAVIAKDSGAASRFRLWPVREEESFEYDDAPHYLAWSLDGGRLLAISNDGQGDLREASELERPLLRLRIDGQPSATALSPDGGTVAIGTEGGSLHIGRLELDGSVRAPRIVWGPDYPSGHTYPIGAIGFAGEQVVSADYIQIKEWDTHGNDGIVHAIPPDEKVLADAGIVLSRDASTAIAVSDVAFVEWDVARGAPMRTVAASSRSSWQTNDLALSAGDLPRVLYWTEHELLVFDPVAARVHRHPAADRIKRASIATDGRAVVYVDADRLRCWRPDTGEDLLIAVLDQQPGVLAATPDGLQVVVGHRGKVTVKSLQPSDEDDEGETLIRAYPRGEAPTCVRFIAGEAVLVAGRRLFSIDMTGRGLTEPRLFDGDHPDDIRAFHCTRDGRRAVTTSPFGGTTVWDLVAGRRLHHFPLGGIAFRISEPFGRALLSTPDGVLKVFSLETGDVIASFQADRQFVGGDADDSLTRIVACDQGGQVHVLRLES